MTSKQGRRAARAYGVLGFASILLGTPLAQAQSPTTTCDAGGIGAATLQADGPAASILSVETATAGSVSYCLVKVLVPRAINIWVGLPMGGAWNGRWQSVGGGVYAGSVAAPNQAVAAGYAAATTDTGHAGRAPPGNPFAAALDGSFGMLEPGKPNTPLQIDFAYRSEHLMAVVGKQLVEAFYGKPPEYSYWNGCSTGGRQGLRMAQDYPDDYDGILAGAPAIHWDRFQAGHIWHQVVQQRDNGGPIGGGKPDVLAAKEKLATAKAIAACDTHDGVADGVLGDPRACDYRASDDRTITSADCEASSATCLTPTEASAIDKMWQGPVACSKRDSAGACSVPDVAARDLDGRGSKRLWYGNTRGTDLTALGGAMPFPVALEQPRYWVYFDPSWDWTTLDYDNYSTFFRDTVARVGPLMASDNPDLTPFRDGGGKLVLWHGWNDQLIAPEGTVDYYDRMTSALGGGYARAQEFARLFMAPGVAHCAGGDGPEPQGLFRAVVDWVEQGKAPDRILASKPTEGGMQTRPLCPYPAQARWTGRGSSDDAANFACSEAGRRD
jgi:hypothetical protein